METSFATAKSENLVACRGCGQVWPIAKHECERCGDELVSRRKDHLQRVWAWWFAGLIAYIPANLYPMLKTRVLFTETSSTIIGGAVDLAHHGAYFVASVVILASVVVPVGKFVAVAYLALGSSGHIASDPHSRHRIHAIVEFIGRWSMIDVFVVAILSALVQLNSIASIHPGPAALSFCLSVVFTMLSAQSFDSRSIWDLDETSPERST